MPASRPVSVCCSVVVFRGWLRGRCLVRIAVDFARGVVVQGIALERAVIASTLDRCYVSYRVVVVDAY